MDSIIYNNQDQHTWRSFLEGDKTSFEKIMKHHFAALFHYGTKFSKDKEFIKDCIQDLFLQLWERRAYLSTDIVVKPYLLASLRRRIHRMGTQQRVTELLKDSSDYFEMEFSIEEKFIQEESTLLLGQQIKMAIDSLPKRQKEVIYLKFYQGLERDQIAEIMDIAPQTISNLLQMAIKQLKKYWKHELIILLLPVLLQ